MDIEFNNVNERQGRYTTLRDWLAVVFRRRAIMLTVFLEFFWGYPCGMVLGGEVLRSVHANPGSGKSLRIRLLRLRRTPRSALALR